jgi:hypothetical protein
MAWVPWGTGFCVGHRIPTCTCTQALQKSMKILQQRITCPRCARGLPAIPTHHSGLISHCYCSFTCRTCIYATPGPSLDHKGFNGHLSKAEQSAENLPGEDDKVEIVVAAQSHSEASLWSNFQVMPRVRLHDNVEGLMMMMCWNASQCGWTVATMYHLRRCTEQLVK